MSIVGRRKCLVMASALLAWPALAWTGVVLAQTKQPILIGWLHAESRSAGGHFLAVFREGMSALGWKEGSNYVLEERWADGRADRVQPLAEELAARKPALIVAAPTGATAAAAKAAPTTPIVQANGGSPMALRLAASLARPGGMVTGVTNITDEIQEKFLELLLAAAPKLQRIGFLVDLNTPRHATFVKDARRAVEQFRVEAHFAEVTRPEELEPALARLATAGVEGLVALPDAGMFTTNRRRIVTFALAQRWPLIAGPMAWAEDGALLSYGADRVALHRRAAHYVDQILKGAKPADLPMEQPTIFELVINLKTAKALELKIPQSILLRANRAIE